MIIKEEIYLQPYNKDQSLYITIEGDSNTWLSIRKVLMMVFKLIGKVK